MQRTATQITTLGILFFMSIMGSVLGAAPAMASHSGYTYQDCIVALQGHPIEKSLFTNAMQWVEKDQKVPKGFEAKAERLVAYLCLQLSKDVAAPIVSFVQRYQKRGRHKRWTKKALVGLGVLGVGAGAAYGVYRHTKGKGSFDVHNQQQKPKEIDFSTPKRRRFGQTEALMGGGAGGPFLDASAYGNKAAHLMELNTLCERLSQETGFAVAVPSFVALSSDEVKKICYERLGIDVAARWHNRETSPPDQELLAAIDQFLGAPADGVPVFTGELATFIADAARDGVCLMVRSSGAEDSETVSNAGGNHTEANVKPNEADLIKAMGKVIASYMSQKSLGQRLLQRDAAVGVGELFCPVLVQRMVGERAGKPLPRCGVMMTEEPEGSFWMEGKGKASGIVSIQAAWGHNELVVNSMGTVDTYRITRDGLLTPIIRRKDIRVGPVAGAEGLHRLKNDSGTAQAPALLVRHIQVLQQVAYALEKYYGGRPQDIEFVIAAGDGGQETLYLVQTRPIVYGSKKKLPTYLVLSNEYRKKAAVVRVVTAADGAVVLIVNEDAVIRRAAVVRRETMLAALTAYQDLPADEQNKVLIFMAEQEAAANSHEINIIRSIGKPALCADRATLDQIEHMIAQDKCYVDVQQGLVVPISGVMLMTGWVSYPLPKECSVTELVGSIDQTRIDRLFKGYDGGKLLADYKAFFSILKTGGPELVHEQCSALFATLKQVLKRAAHTPYQARARSLVWHIGLVARKILASRNIVKEDPLFLTSRLYPIHLLDTLIYQQSTDKDCLFADSLTKLLKDMRAEFPATQKGESSIEPHEVVRLMDMLGSVIVMPEAAGKWHEIAQLFKKSAKQLDKDAELVAFGNNLRMLHECDVLALWANTLFSQMATSEKIASGMVHEINRSLLAVRGAIDELRDVRQALSRVSIESFRSCTTFLGAWNEFKAECIVPLVSGKNMQLLKNGGVAAIVQLQMMERCLDTFDAIIKAVCDGDQFEARKYLPGDVDDWLKLDSIHQLEEAVLGKNKPLCLYVLLSELCSVFGTWGEALSAQQKALLAYQVPPAGGSKYPEVENHKENQVEELSKRFLPGVLSDCLFTAANQPEEILKLREQFNVALVAYGSRGYFSKKAVSASFAEVFTYLHQSTLNVIGCYAQQFCGEVAQASVGSYIQKLQQFYTENIEGSLGRTNSHQSGVKLNHFCLTSLHVRGNLLAVRYVIAMREHGASVDFEFDMNSKQVRGVTVINQGKDECVFLDHCRLISRWRLAAAFAEGFQRQRDKSINIKKGKSSVAVAFAASVLDGSDLDLIGFVGCMLWTGAMAAGELPCFIKDAELCAHWFWYMLFSENPKIPRRDVLMFFFTVCSSCFLEGKEGNLRRGIETFNILNRDPLFDWHGQAGNVFFETFSLIKHRRIWEILPFMCCFPYSNSLAAAYRDSAASFDVSGADKIERILRFAGVSRAQFDATLAQYRAFMAVSSATGTAERGRAAGSA